jgi:3-hydroxybutyryl-CoA dehydratase
MTPSREPVIRTGTNACRYSELAVGDQLSGALTITETHVVLAAAAFNDPGPNHVNELQASRGRFGRRIAHGPLLVGVMAGTLGNVLGSTIVALLDQQATFHHPVHLGDTVLCRWTVSDLVDKASFAGGGIVRFEGEARNAAGRRLSSMTASLAVADEPLWDDRLIFEDKEPARAKGSDPT